MIEFHLLQTARNLKKLSTGRRASTLSTSSSCKSHHSLSSILPLSSPCPPSSHVQSLSCLLARHHYSIYPSSSSPLPPSQTMPNPTQTDIRYAYDPIEITQKIQRNLASHPISTWITLDTLMDFQSIARTGRTHWQMVTERETYTHTEDTRERNRRCCVTFVIATW